MSQREIDIYHLRIGEPEAPFKGFSLILKCLRILAKRRAAPMGSAAKARKNSSIVLDTEDFYSARPPARTTEARENQMISLAIDLAEEQLKNKTASSQTIAHFLKLGSTKELLEKEILELQKGLIAAKTEAIQSTKRMEELYVNAMKAMSTYSGGRVGGTIAMDDVDE